MFLAGGVAGALSVCLNNPIDVVKTRMQGSNTGTPATITTTPQSQPRTTTAHPNTMITIAGTSTMLSTVVETWRSDGIMAFTSGLSARVPRLFISQAIQFSLVDAIVTSS